MFKSGLATLACFILVGCGSREEPQGAAEKLPRVQSDTSRNRHYVQLVLRFVQGDSGIRLDEEAMQWTLARPYEKLAASEAILSYLTSRTKLETTPELLRLQNDSDFSLQAGRAEWCIERLLGVELPMVHASATAEDLERLHAEALQAARNYRTETIAHAAKQRIPPAEFARLKRKYRGKAVPIAPFVFHDFIDQMDNLLGEWPPTGRKYEDLVAITGAKAQGYDRHAKGAVRYRLEVGASHEADFIFVVEDGVIQSVHTHEQGF